MRTTLLLAFFVVLVVCFFDLTSLLDPLPQPSYVQPKSAANQRQFSGDKEPRERSESEKLELLVSKLEEPVSQISLAAEKSVQQEPAPEEADTDDESTTRISSARKSW